MASRVGGAGVSGKPCTGGADPWSVASLSSKSAAKSFEMVEAVETVETLLCVEGAVDVETGFNGGGGIPVKFGRTINKGDSNVRG